MMGSYWKTRDSKGRPEHGRISTSSIDSSSSLDSTSSMDTTVSTDSQQQQDDFYLMDVIDDNNNNSNFPPETILSKTNSARLTRKTADRGTANRKYAWHEDRNNNTINTISEACEQRDSLEADITNNILSSTSGSEGPRINNDNNSNNKSISSSAEDICCPNQTTRSSEDQITTTITITHNNNNYSNNITGSEGDCNNKNTSGSKVSKNSTERTRLLDADGFIRRAACVCVDETESKTPDIGPSH
ncbi:hypothetical protein Pmani_033738 [Petrolisthes manimaculis]|uniref:Uncharacterized protein n=1 Tax=Petrolisthes manimaculis TaxID=1843537 RepID=A0AAE1TPU4_9EUCA|nr:hypothetical protein Pmani_033738 [Petrolisthes manimaculis]